MSEQGTTIDYRIGTMIEPAVALSPRTSPSTDFFSFGTNDLTQMTFGFSRDDMGKFLTPYLGAGILTDSPLAKFDIDGVGQLVQMGTERASQQCAAQGRRLR